MHTSSILVLAAATSSSTSTNANWLAILLKIWTINSVPPTSNFCEEEEEDEVVRDVSFALIPPEPPEAAIAIDIAVSIDFTWLQVGDDIRRAVSEQSNRLVYLSVVKTLISSDSCDSLWANLALHTFELCCYFAPCLDIIVPDLFCAIPRL